MFKGTLAFALPLFVIGLATMNSAGRTQPPDLVPPVIQGSPPSPVSSEFPYIELYFCDNISLNAASRELKMNGTVVTSSYTYSAGADECIGYSAKATVSGSSVSVNLGNNTFYAKICDNNGNCTDRSWTITRITTPVVTPDAQALQVSAIPNATLPFNVTNPNPIQRTFSISASCSGIATTCSAPANVTLAAGETREIAASLTTSGATGTGTITLTASDQGLSNPGSYDLTIGPPRAQPRDQCLTIAAGAGAASECGDLRLTHALPTVRTLNKARAPVLIYNSQHAHPYPLVAADVTMPGGDPLPTTVQATLTVNSVQYQRSWAGSAWGSAGQTRRIQVAFDGLSASLATGAYPYSLEIRRVTGGSNTVLITFSGDVFVVNRSASPFGPGWWIAGYERLVFSGMPAAQVLWVGGDGSVVVYQRVGAIGSDSIYLGTSLDHPDTLRRVAGSPVEWKRLLSGGDTVVFNSSGIHARTASRLGYRTTFFDTTVAGVNVPARIRVPPDTAQLEYQFTYSGSPARLTQVTSPDSGSGTRTTSLVWAGDSVRITDPGTSAPVTFRYQSGGTHRVQHRADRRGAVTRFAYDSGFRLMSSQLALGGSDSINVSFCHGDLRGMTACSPSIVAPDSAYTLFDGPRAPSGADTVPDVIHFWTDVLGAPFKVRDADQNVTTITRANLKWPALITRVQYPSGRILGVTHDPRGNVAASTDSNRYVAGQHAITSYTWDQKWDRVTKIVQPTGDSARFAYDASTGNRSWQEDGRGSSSRVNFTYYTSGDGAGLLKLVTDPLGAVDSLAYDLRGNLKLTRSPLGYVTTTVLDRIGRPTLVETPVGSVVKRDSSYYDQRGLVIRSVAYGPTLSGVDSQKVVVRSHYNAEGQLDSLKRISIPDPEAIDTITTRWRYDLAGRRVAEISSDMQVDSTRYDPAGNAIAAVTRRGHTLTMAYDRLNRLRRRIIPAVEYYGRLLGIDMTGTEYGGLRPYPWFPTVNNCVNQPDECYADSTQWRMTLPADTALFTYDAMGNVLTADNAQAKVKRSYFNDGQVKTDTLRVRTWLGSDFNRHTYGIAYKYDLAGRLTTLAHPAPLAPRASGVVKDTARYEYDAVTGTLAAVVDPLGNRFEYTYNLRNEIIRLELPGGITDTLTYDNDGRRTTEQVLNGSTAPSELKHPDASLRHHVLHYTDAFRVDSAKNLAGWGDTTTVLYSGLGHVIRSKYWAPARNGWLTGSASSTERVLLDGLGNNRQTVDTNNLTSTVKTMNNLAVHGHSYHAGTGRLRGTLHQTSGNPNTDRTDSTLYDAAGNVVFSYQVSAGASATLEDHAYFYGADGMLRVSEYRTKTIQSGDDPYRLVVEDYHYDALGRRVAVIMRRMCNGAYHLRECNWESARRTVWQGQAELYEIQAYGGYRGYDWPGEYTPPDTAKLENDTLPVVAVRLSASTILHDASPNFGRVAYTHGPSVDQPLSAIRIHFTRVLNKFPGGFLDTATFDPIAVAPHWNWRGQADFGTLADGGWRARNIYDPGDTVYAAPPWRIRGFMFTQQLADVAMPQWWGGLINLKEDGSGTQYRRNRYLDPATGRFTQEDPIGLAGGLNLYGFAAGDPVNFRDPFGLCPPKDNNDGPDCKVSFGGVSFSLFGGVGVTVAFGAYINGEGEGYYLRVGLGTGLEAGGGVEAGESKNRAAFEKGASEKCGSVSAPGVCVSTNDAGTTGSGTLSLGAPAGYHSASTYTFTTKPVRSGSSFDCSKPQPHNSVCNR